MEAEAETSEHLFLHSIEQECMSTVAGTDDAARIDRALRLFVKALAQEAPCLRGSEGLFNAYGRVYVDCGGHLELAAIECDSPYYLARAVEAQNVLVGRARGALAAQGVPLRLANNNHSGLLHSGANTWGTHENYLVGVHPAEFSERILPFLATRIYGGAGGVRHPTGDFLAAVRPEFMRRSTGGSTTQNRAIHSTCREEHHMGPRPSSFRYHLILGDGHRSQFNLALQIGATALALKVVEQTPDLEQRLASVGSIRGRSSWVATLNRFNLLARAGRRPQVAPKVIAVQRVYLEAAREWHERGPDRPQWVARLLDDWSATLAALESMDLDWLSARLDTFIKYQLYSEVLRGAGRTWADVCGSDEVQSELALIDHAYHAFCDARSPFARLEELGLLQQRVGAAIEPGGEAEPFVPDTCTRARARARFIRDHAREPRWLLDWAMAYDEEDGAHRDLSDPFAARYSEPVRARSREAGTPQASVRALLRRRAARALDFQQSGRSHEPTPD